jgi:DNA anti-recombination protein RmuC
MNDGMPASQSERIQKEMMVEMKPNQERLEAKADVTLRETKVEIRSNQERMEAKIEANNNKFETLQGTVRSQMDIHQARTEAIQEEMEAKMNKIEEKLEAAIVKGQEEMRAMISSIWPQLEESMKRQVEDVLGVPRPQDPGNSGQDRGNEDPNRHRT